VHNERLNLSEYYTSLLVNNASLFIFIQSDLETIIIVGTEVAVFTI